ncbi:hypothetical protein ABT218_35115 [Streptomyces sp. NPDC001455]|uniref:hypothetical protein n=1 Tax=Streptomyces sp. NPDC001455 TaxID=3154518 RepID=UPI0033188FCF
MTDHAERLYTQPSVDDLFRPIPVGGPTDAGSMPAALEALTARIGRPSAFGGGGGPSVRWRSEAWTLMLEGRDGLQLWVHRTADLEASDLAAFEGGVGDGPGQAVRYTDLPYLWQIHTSSTGTHQPASAAAPPATSWERVEESLQATMQAWVTQMPDQLGPDADWAASFDILNRADGNRRLVVLYSPRDDLSVFINDEDGPDDDAGKEDSMVSRGWMEWLPVLRWWQAAFAPDAGGAAAAARLIVAELHLRGASSPDDLVVADITAGEAGQLSLPGLGIVR